MKMMKKLLVLVAAMTMVLSLTACGGESWPKSYSYSEPRGEGEQAATLTLEEDGTCEYVFYATESNGSGNKVMEVVLKGTYTMADNTVTIETVEEGTGYYVAGASQTDFTFTKEDPGMYANTYSAGSFVFTVDGETFGPVVE